MDDDEKAGESIVVAPTDLPLRARARGLSTPGKITDEVLAAICARVESGSHLNHACALEGVSDRALRALRAAHEDIDIAVAKAVARKMEDMREKFGELIDSDAKTAGHWLHMMERHDPAAYGPPKQRIEQTGEDGGPIKTESAVRWYVPRNPRIPTGEEDE